MNCKLDQNTPNKGTILKATIINTPLMNAALVKTNVKTKIRSSLRLLLVVSSAAAALMNVNSFAADAARGNQLSQTCLGCHGAPGLRNPGPVYKIPMIGGQHPEYIISALKAYKSKERSHATMQAQAASLSDQDMADIAAFFNQMNGNSRPSNVSQHLAKAGQEKSALCATCHGPTGDGENVTYPKLAGQYESYLTQALKDYRSGDRKNPIMAGFVSDLTINDIRALSAWFAGQEGALSAPESKIFK